MSNVNFRDVNWYDLAPPWLRIGNGEKYGYVLQSMTDMLLEKTDQSVRIRLPGQGDVSQLPYLSYDRQIVQGPAEPDAQFVTELQDAIVDWGLAGSRVAILKRAQSYIQGLDPGVAVGLPKISIVSTTPAQTATSANSFAYPAMAQWDSLYHGDALGHLPAHQVVPLNFNWDGKNIPTRAWLILYMALVPTGLSGSAATTGTAAPSACFASPGQLGSAVDDSTGITYPACWIPATSGTPINSPWLTILGLAGLSSANVGQWLTLSGSSHAVNNGSFPIVSVPSSSSAVIANPNGVPSDSTALAWSVGSYPFMAPAPVWGAADVTLTTAQIPPLDLGSNVGGVWQPNTLAAGSSPTCWGVSTSPHLLASIVALVKQWKSAKSYYKHLVIAFDGANGAPGSAYAPASTAGSGNPNGQFASYGSNVGGVWVPVASQNLGSPFDAYCNGTGVRRNCAIENET